MVRRRKRNLCTTRASGPLCMTPAVCAAPADYARRVGTVTASRGTLQELCREEAPEEEAPEEERAGTGPA